VGRVVRGAVEWVVEGIGDFKKIVASSNDLPLGRYFELVEQRNQPVEYLRHSSSDRSGVHHLYGLSLNSLGQKADFIQFGLPDDGSAIVKPRRRCRRRGSLPAPRVFPL